MYKPRFNIYNVRCMVVRGDDGDEGGGLRDTSLHIDAVK